MSDIKIVERARNKLTWDEFLHLQDYFISKLKDEERTNYSKGYNAGKKKAYSECSSHQQEVKG